MNGPNGNTLSPAEVLADRLEWMRDRLGRDPEEMLRNQYILGEMTSSQADAVRAILRQRSA